MNSLTPQCAVFWGPTVIVCLIAITTFQIISGLDARALHDPVLLPLNIAAYCNEDKSGSTLLGAFTIKLVSYTLQGQNTTCL
jgi:hypothetical protein